MVQQPLLVVQHNMVVDGITAVWQQNNLATVDTGMAIVGTMIDYTVTLQGLTPTKNNSYNGISNVI